uniref:IFT122 first beta-propeller domain-containing protein n=1 Tax=Tetranychus urticae TaxID=32264 RepID=T1KLI8_TETUR
MKKSYSIIEQKAIEVFTLTSIFSKTVDLRNFLIPLMDSVFVGLQTYKVSTLNSKVRFFTTTPLQETHFYPFLAICFPVLVLCLLFLFSNNSVFYCLYLVSIRHNESVRCLQFNSINTGKLVSCANLDFGIWSPDQKSVIKHKISFPINCCARSFDGHHLALGTNAGYISIRSREKPRIDKMSSEAGSIRVITFITSKDDETITFATADWSKSLTLLTFLVNKLGYEPLSLQSFSSGDYLVISGTNREAVLHSKDGITIGSIHKDCAILPFITKNLAMTTQNGNLVVCELIFSTVHSLFSSGINDMCARNTLTFLKLTLSDDFQKYSNKFVKNVIIQHLIKEKKGTTKFAEKRTPGCLSKILALSIECDPLPEIVDGGRCTCIQGFAMIENTCVSNDKAPCNVVKNCHADATCKFNLEEKQFKCECNKGCVFSPTTREYKCRCNNGFSGDGLDCSPNNRYDRPYSVAVQGMSFARLPMAPGRQGEFLFVNNVHRVGRNGGKEEILMIPKGSNGRLHGIVAMAEACPAMSNPCRIRNGGCKHLCLQSGPRSRTCVCPDDDGSGEECTLMLPPLPRPSPSGVGIIGIG